MIISGKKMYSFIAVVFAVIFPVVSFAQESIDVALNTLTDQINKYMVEQKKAKIAIIPFPDLQKQAVTVLGSYIAEELMTNLFTTGKFKIVERSLLKQVLDELKLGQTGIIDASSAKEFGKMTGVDAVVAGTVTELGSYIAVNCRLIETESGEVFAVAKAKINIDENIKRIMSETTGKSESQIGSQEQETKKRITEGAYDVEANEIKFGDGRGLLLYFGISKIEISKDYLKISFYVKNERSISSSARFELEGAFILDSMQRKHYLKNVDGLKEGRGIVVSGVRVRGTPNSSEFYYEDVQKKSRIWGSLFFPRFELQSPDFLLYINGKEIEVKLVISN